MEALAYYDGKIGTPSEVMVPFNDRVHFFGDGCYDATVGANGKVYLLQDHLDRFYTSAKLLDIRIPMEKEALERLETVMTQAGELTEDQWVDFHKLVDNHWAQEAR